MTTAWVRAPELPEGLTWFNTAKPLTIAGLRGRVVLLDFWTPGCINCLHVLQDLRYLENKYRGAVAVIGIHSPKFSHERIAANVQKAINRFHVRHPVVNDPKLVVWKQYGVRGWPSVAVIDPEGYLRGVLAGEGRRKQLDLLIQHQLALAERRGLRVGGSLPVSRTAEPAGALQFPSKVYATAERLYISDTGRNRILQTNYHGRVMRVIGSGAPSHLDAGIEQASFNEPHGLAGMGDDVLIADRGNHAIRRLRVISQEVETVAGTGSQGRHAGEHFPDPLKAPLNSPWDVLYHAGSIYIAMAGQHQIWRLNTSNWSLDVFAGSGREGLTDGPATSASLAQPSGLAAGSEELYVADAESSAIRTVRLADGYVRTLIGKGLFEFGDIDGDAGSARLQHPMGISFDRNRNALWIADTYNDKIKMLEIYTKRVTTLKLDRPLHEPGGLCVQGDYLWVADTNAHEIIRVDLRAGVARPLEIEEQVVGF
ncbi:MAG: redoxin family protein [Gammaproteobacteria bacterium]|nr:redoxin family protein [Gammaproteobacteria bacterium]NIR85779.1 redoxin family protein [Gammaproteobacteria bacterium]NIV75711.1 redoxin family protein [Gammaproteobacteria bacterium]